MRFGVNGRKKVEGDGVPPLRKRASAMSGDKAKMSFNQDSASLFFFKATNMAACESVSV